MNLESNQNFWIRKTECWKEYFFPSSKEQLYWLVMPKCSVMQFHLTEWYFQQHSEVKTTNLAVLVQSESGFWREQTEYFQELFPLWREYLLKDWKEQMESPWQEFSGH